MVGWEVVCGKKVLGSTPIYQRGDVTFIDALSLCDALGVSYHRDETGRYIFSFPGMPVAFLPDGAFAQVGMEIVHLPNPAFCEGYRFFVPQTVFLEIASSFTPGVVLLDESIHRILFTLPKSDILEIRGRQEGTESVYTLTLTRPFSARIFRLESGEIALAIDSADVQNGCDSLDLDSNLAVMLKWEKKQSRLLFASALPIQHARLEGPDLGNEIVIRFSAMVDTNSEKNKSKDPLFSKTLESDRQRWRIDKIVIDAGHGGKDPGAIGKKRTYEKTVALNIALKLRQVVWEKLGAEVIMTRDSDVFIPLGERTRIANRSQGKLFISIHCNSARDKRANGHETYFLAPAKTERAMAVALKENSVIKYEESQDQYKDLTEENYILLAMAQSQFVKESEYFAALIQKHLYKRTSLKDRGVDQAGFYVLIGASMPCVLVETGFISNSSEEKLLKSDWFQQEIAKGICDAIIEFIRTLENEG